MDYELGGGGGGGRGRGKGRGGGGGGGGSGYGGRGGAGGGYGGGGGGYGHDEGGYGGGRGGGGYHGPPRGGGGGGGYGADGFEAALGGGCGGGRGGGGRRGTGYGGRGGGGGGYGGGGKGYGHDEGGGYGGGRGGGGYHGPRRAGGGGGGYGADGFEAAGLAESVLRNVARCGYESPTPSTRCPSPWPGGTSWPPGRPPPSAFSSAASSQKQATVLLKECQDIQLRCGSSLPNVNNGAFSASIISVLSNVEQNMKDNMAFKDINGLVQQNVQLRNQVHMLSADLGKKDMELRATIDTIHTTEEVREYKEIAHSNEVVLKQLESAHQDYKAEAEVGRKALEDFSLRNNIPHLKQQEHQQQQQHISQVKKKMWSDDVEAKLSTFYVEELEEENIKPNLKLEIPKHMLEILKKKMESEGHLFSIGQIGNKLRKMKRIYKVYLDLMSGTAKKSEIQDGDAVIRKMKDGLEPTNIKLLKQMFGEGGSNGGGGPLEFLINNQQENAEKLRGVMDAANTRYTKLEAQLMTEIEELKAANLDLTRRCEFLEESLNREKSEKLIAVESYEKEKQERESVESSQDLLTVDLERVTSDAKRFSEQGGSNAGGSAGGGPLEFLRNNQEFQKFRDLVHRKPESLKPILQGLSEKNPQIIRLIDENFSEFLQFLSEPFEVGEGDLEQPEQDERPHVVFVTPEELEAIGRLESMGFERARVLEAFCTCDRNEKHAANYLLEHRGEEE